MTDGEMMVDRNYQILGTLATGGTSVLYRAIQTSLGREVVIKKLHSHLTSDSSFTSRFKLEAKAAASLDHENIVRIIDTGVSRDNYFIVMEHIDGLSLKEILERDGSLDAEAVLMIAREICLGLDHAHRRGIIHRDIKPANIMITREGQVKITDFGLAKLIESAGQQTVADTLIGTPLYMSPEQAIGEGIDGRSDLFSLGTVCYELLTGRQPFTAPNYASVIQKIINGSPAPVSRLREGIDRETESIVSKAMDREPRERFRTAMEMAGSIEDLVGRERLAATRTRLRGLVAGEKARSAEDARRETPRAGRRSSRLLTGAVAAAMVAIAAVYVSMDSSRIDSFRTMIRSLRAGGPVPAGEVRTLPASDFGLDGSAAAWRLEQAGLEADTAAQPAGVNIDDPGAGGPGAGPVTGASGIPLIDTLSAPAYVPEEDTAAAAAATPEDEGGIEAPGLEEPAESGTGEPAQPERSIRAGLIDIHVEPEALIRIDGELVFTGNRYGPAEIAPGAHRISCRQRDFEEYAETVRIVPGELSKRRIKLQRKTGRLSFTTGKGIQVFVNGKFRGMTPLSSPVTLPAGKHLVELKKNGCHDWSSEVFVPADETVDLKITLVPVEAGT